MKLKHKLRLNIYLTVLVVLIAGTVIFIGDREANRLSKLAIESSNIARSVTDLEILTHQYLIYIENASDDISETRQQDQWQQKYNSLIQQLKSTTFIDKDEIRLYQQIQMNIGKLYNHYRKLQAEILKRNRPDYQKEITRDRITSMSGQILVVSQELVSNSFILQNLVEKKTFSSQHRINLIILFLSLFLVISLAVINQFTASGVIRSTDSLMNDIDYISDGNLDYQVKVWSDDEIGVLASTINRMTNRLNNLTTTRDNLVQEIDERVRIEEALKESNQTLETILSSSPIGIAMIDDGKVRWANSGMLMIFFFEDEGMQNVLFPTLFATGQEYEKLSRLQNEMLLKNLPVETDVLCQRKDGSKFPAHIKISRIDKDETRGRLIVTISDESWRKMAEAERLAKERLEVTLELAGAVCHEMNQPLQYLSSVIELRTMNEKSPEGIKTLEKLKSQVDRLAEITDKLQHITHVETQDYIDGNKILDLESSSDFDNLHE